MIRLFDWQSLYPNMMIGGNLFSPTTLKPPHSWQGNNIFTSKFQNDVDGLQGCYLKQPGKIEKTILSLLNERILLKETLKHKDAVDHDLYKKKILAVKILINTCFSKDTNILTTTGIKPLKDVVVGEKVYSVNKKTKEVEVDTVIETQCFNHTDDMVTFSNTNTNICVTKDHSVLYEKNGTVITDTAENVAKIARAKQVQNNPSNSIMRPYCKNDYIHLPSELGYLHLNKDTQFWVKLDDPYSQRKNKGLVYDQNTRTHKSIYGYLPSLYKGEWTFNTRKREGRFKAWVDKKAFAYFLGIYIAEGSSRIISPKEYDTATRGTTFVVTIAQKKVNEPIRNKIELCLKTLGVRYSKTDAGFDICSKTLYTYLTQVVGVGSQNKRIPKAFFEYGENFLSSLHEGLYDGDGTKAQYIYTTNSVQLRDDVITLNLLLGYRCRYIQDSSCWRIYRVSQGEISKRIAQNTPYNDKVYCVTTAKNHTVYVERNGKFSWVGQCYGIMGSPIFKSVYNLTSAADCTAMARRSIKHARTVFEHEEYECLYTDTDSIFVLDKEDNLNKVQAIANQITQDQISSFNVKTNTHKLDLEKNIKRMWFFKNDSGIYIKKHYVYVDENDNLTVKGLKVVKGDCTKLAKMYWDTVLSKEFVANTFEWLEPEILLIELKRIAKSDPSLLEKRFRVNPPETYKIREGSDNPTAIQFQIAAKYGAGEHWLIINKRIGPGKLNHYAPMCVLKDKYGDNWVDYVCYEEYMKDLSPFILPENRNKIHKTDRKRV